MKSSKALAVSAAVWVVMSLATRAAAEPVRLKSPTHCVTERGNDVHLPPGVFLPEPDWLKLDTEVRRLQEQETRLTAENKSLRESLDSGPGWRWVGLALGTGIVIGFVAFR